MFPNSDVRARWHQFSRAITFFLGVLDFLARVVVIIAMTGVALTVALQVVLRYGLRSSIMGSDELARLFFVWAVFLSIPLAIKAKRHVMIGFFVSQLSSPIRKATSRLMLFCGCAILGVAGYQASRVAGDNWDQTLPTLNVSAGMFFMAVAIGCFHGALHLAVALVSTDPHTPEQETGGVL